MKAWTVIGYTADADYWCEDCAATAYGPDTESRKDSEGNDVHPIFASDDTPADAVCGRCFASIVEG